MRRGAGPARHCAACVERVYDLAAMTASEIIGLAILKGGSFCGRQVIDRARDQLVVRPPPPPRARRSLFDWRNVARSAAFFPRITSA